MEKQKIGIVICLLWTGIVGFLMGCYSLIPSVIVHISAIVGAILFSLLIYFSREILTEFWNLFLLIGGMTLGLLLNESLSTESLSDPSISFMMAFSLVTGVMLLLNFSLIKTISFRRKAAFVFLGSSIISLILALSGFVRVVMAWLPLRWYEEVPGGFLMVNISIIINILKSLFLAGLFNVLERLTRLSEDSP